MSHEEDRRHAKSCGHCNRHLLPVLDELQQLGGQLRAASHNEMFYAESLSEMMQLCVDAVSPGRDFDGNPFRATVDAQAVRDVLNRADHRPIGRTA